MSGRDLSLETAGEGGSATTGIYFYYDGGEIASLGERREKRTFE